MGDDGRRTAINAMSAPTAAMTKGSPSRRTAATPSPTAPAATRMASETDWWQPPPHTGAPKRKPDFHSLIHMACAV